jgi:hypothetical protein
MAKIKMFKIIMARPTMAKLIIGQLIMVKPIRIK